MKDAKGDAFVSRVDTSGTLITYGLNPTSPKRLASDVLLYVLSKSYGPWYWLSHSHGELSVSSQKHPLFV